MSPKGEALGQLWRGEANRREWRHAGLPCLIVRNDVGALCGYAAVSPGHPLYGWLDHEVDLNVHGGITYSGHCHGRVCHEARPGEPRNVWWLGFDCAHAGDLIPFMTTPFDMPGDVYRDMSFVTQQVEQLAEQLAAMVSGGRPHAS